MGIDDSIRIRRSKGKFGPRMAKNGSSTPLFSQKENRHQKFLAEEYSCLTGADKVLWYVPVDGCNSSAPSIMERM